ncbi:MAG: toprim domain-containing protein [Actinomycetales bacterium]|nr:toprim domain-containing protein [Actinomycetales bacterium]
MNHTEAESVKVGNEPCPDCRENGRDNSGDNLVRYSDGHGYCFACERYERGDGTATGAPAPAPTSFNPRRGELAPLPTRGIDMKAVRAYGYQTMRNANGEFEIANYFNSNELVAQHVKQTLEITTCPETGEVLEEKACKKFFWIGQPGRAELYGQHLWRNEGGRKLVITEGEVDCLTVAQLFQCKYPVVSLGGGAAGAVKEIKRNLEFVASYDEVILMLDMDEAGQAAASKISDILPPGKCKIAKLPHKDANECLLNNDGKAVTQAFWEAKMASPDEILHVSDIDIFAEKEKQKVWPFPWPAITRHCLGQRSGEMNLYASGTGSGKSTFVRELAHHHLEQGRSVGMIMLEESPAETLEDLITLRINKPVRKILTQRAMNEVMQEMGEDFIDCGIHDDLTTEELVDAQSWFREKGLYIYDHMGANGISNILSRCELLATGMGVDVIIVDHVTAAATGLMQSADKDVEGGSSERLIIDALMRDLRSLVTRTGVHVDVVSQLKKGDKAFEEGARITLQDLKGAGSLGSVPNTIFSIERNRQLEDERAANTSTVRVLKSRVGTQCGIAGALLFNHGTGRMEETDFVTDDSGEITFDPDVSQVDF